VLEEVKFKRKRRYISRSDRWRRWILWLDPSSSCYVHFDP